MLHSKSMVLEQLWLQLNKKVRMTKNTVLNKSMFSVFIISLIFLSGCGSVGEGINSAYNMTQCEYKYKDVSNITLSGMNLSNGISPLYIPKILSAISGVSSSVPLDFTLNIDVTNTNGSPAAFIGLQYILSIDDVQFTTGKINQPFTVNGNSSKMMPITIGLDLATLLKGDTKDAVQNIVKNFIGVNSQQSNVKLQIKPTFMIANHPVTSPMYIPISFSFGGN